MTSQPPVSIFIVTYLASAERGAILRRTCEAALAQRYPDFEVVVSENPGPFRAQEALASIRDPRLKVFRSEENEGFTGNINRCIALCSHDIIKLLCDDDLIHPDFLARTVPLVDDGTMVLTDVLKFRIGEEPAALREAYDQPLASERRSAGYGRDIWTLPYAPGSIPSATLFTRALFERLGRFDRRTITSDWDFFVEACLHAEVVHVAQALCYVGVWSGSLTEEMLDRPFFYPQAGLYTRFRVFHRKNIPIAQRAALLGMLLKDFLLQSLRPLKRMNRKAYRAGYRDYAARFFKLLFSSKTEIGPRPLQLP